MLGHHGHMLLGPALVGDGQRARGQLRRVQPTHINAVAVGIDDHPLREGGKGVSRPAPGADRQVCAHARLACCQVHGIDRCVLAIIRGVGLPIVCQVRHIAVRGCRQQSRLACRSVIGGDLRHGRIHVLRPHLRLHQRQVLSVLIGAHRLYRAVSPTPGHQLAGIQRIAFHGVAAFPLAVALHQHHRFAVLHKHGAGKGAEILVIRGLFLPRLQRAQDPARRFARGVHQQRNPAAALVIAVEALAVGEQGVDHQSVGVLLRGPEAHQLLQHDLRLIHSGLPALQLHPSLLRVAVNGFLEQVQACSHGLCGADRHGVRIAVIGHDIEVLVHSLGQR